MSSLAPLVINSMLGSQPSTAVHHDVPSTITEKSSESSKIIRKHYSDGGAHHYDIYQHHGSSNGYHGGGGYGKKSSRSVALTALTLLAFLFFLNILQQCLQEQMDTLNPQVVIMQARIKAAREAEKLAKKADRRVGESLKSVPTATPSSTETAERFVEFEDGADLYHYEKFEVPVKMKMLEKYGRP